MYLKEIVRETSDESFKILSFYLTKIITFVSLEIAINPQEMFISSTYEVWIKKYRTPSPSRNSFAVMQIKSDDDTGMEEEGLQK